MTEFPMPLAHCQQRRDLAGYALQFTERQTRVEALQLNESIGHRLDAQHHTRRHGRRPVLTPCPAASCGAGLRHKESLWNSRPARLGGHCRQIL